MGRKRKYGKGLKVTFTGEASGKCKYSDKQVEEIIKAKQTMTYKEIEAAYGIHRRTVQSFIYVRKPTAVKIERITQKKVRIKEMCDINNCDIEVESKKDGVKK